MEHEKKKKATKVFELLMLERDDVRRLARLTIWGDERKILDGMESRVLELMELVNSLLKEDE